MRTSLLIGLFGDNLSVNVNSHLCFLKLLICNTHALRWFSEWHSSFEVLSSGSTSLYPLLRKKFKNKYKNLVKTLNCHDTLNCSQDIFGLVPWRKIQYLPQKWSNWEIFLGATPSLGGNMLMATDGSLPSFYLRFVVRNHTRDINKKLYPSLSRVW